LDQAEIESLCEGGFIMCEGDQMTVTRDGRRVLNAITERLLLA